jgi:hypothetical protein
MSAGCYATHRIGLALPAAAGAAFYAWGVTRLGVGEFAALGRAVLRRLGRT